MRLCSCELVNFRNYERISLSFDAGTNILYGQNAQGKTNFLEAIYLCTCARSHRTGRDDELVRQGEDFYRSTVRFVTDRGIEESLSVEYHKANIRGAAPSRVIRYNDLEVARLADMMGLFHAILFAPEDLQIVKDGPSERRRFLDILISRTDRSYFRELQEFWRVIGHRNRLLKQQRDEAFAQDVTQLDIWDESLAEVASSILVKRLSYVEKLERYAALSLRHLTASKEELSLQYKGFLGLVEGMDEAMIRERYLARLERLRDDDLFRGNTSQGPHRDDMLITLNGSDARLYASQGQQRSVVLALKIAELLILSEISGEKPILLLDDVMSELDQSRRSRLMEVISDHQVFMTLTDPESIGNLNALQAGNINYYKVQNAEIHRVERPTDP